MDFFFDLTGRFGSTVLLLLMAIIFAIFSLSMVGVLKPESQSFLTKQSETLANIFKRKPKK